MLIILLLNILGCYLFGKSVNRIGYRKDKFYLCLLLGFVIQLLLFVIYRFDLASLGREVYYSDAETYWKNTLELINYGHSDGYNSLYYYLCYLVQMTSPFIWPGWNNLFNITCINLCVVLMLDILSNYVCRLKNYDYKNLEYFIILVMSNPFIVYGLMRNLKDALFMLMTFLVIYIVEVYFRSKKKLLRVMLILSLLCFIYVFLLIRPWGFLIPIIALLYILVMMIWQNRNNIKNVKMLFFKSKKLLVVSVVSIVIVVACCLLFLLPQVMSTLTVWMPTVLNEFNNRSILDIIIGTGKFIIAPGPIRSLLGSKYFEHYTISGNYMCALGALMWWISIIIMIASIIVDKEKISNLKNRHFVKLLLLILLAYVMMYVIQYGGTVEIRLRSVLYVLVYSLFFGIAGVKGIKENKTIYSICSVIMMVGFVIISYIGM